MWPLRGVDPDVEKDSGEFVVPPEVTVAFVGLSVGMGPFPMIGEIVAVRFTIPEKPLTLEIVRPAIVEEP